MEEIKKKEEIQEEEKNPVKKIDFRFEIALFFILGFLLGIVIKTEASKRVTIGFNDNEIASVKQAFNFEKIKEEIAKEVEVKEGSSNETPSSENKGLNSEGGQNN